MTMITVTTIDEAIDHLYQFHEQEHPADIARGADLVRAGKGRVAAEELLGLGYSPKTLEAWQQFFAYVSRYEISGLVGLNNEVRTNGVDREKYAAFIILNDVPVPSQPVDGGGGTFKTIPVQ